MMTTKRIAWPPGYAWLHDYLAARPGAEPEYKDSWDAMLYRVHGKIFGLLLENREDGVLLNLKCDPYLSLAYRDKHPSVRPGWHMNKRHWISLVLREKPGEELCRELADHSHAQVVAHLPRYLQKDGFLL